MEQAQNGEAVVEATTGAVATTLLVAKVGAMLILGCGSLLVGTLPLMIRLCRTKGLSSAAAASAAPRGLLTSLLLCFGGGVLLFTTFLHLAPEVRESVEQHQKLGQLGSIGNLSLTELLFCGGFFFVYLVEEAVHWALEGRAETSNEAMLYRTVSLRRCNGSSMRKEKADGRRAESTDAENTAQTPPPSIFVIPTVGQAEYRGIPRSKKNGYDADHAVKPSREYKLQEHGDTAAEGAATDSAASIRSLLAVVALSFHAIFEGLAVGLEPLVSSVVYLGAAIATHKFVIGFCVGMELLVAGATTRTIVIYMAVFSLVTPLGIGAGLVLGQMKNESETLGPVPTILQGMAAGTLLYVVFFEVLAREKANEKSGLLQLLAIILGFVLMLGLQLATGHSHAHDTEVNDPYGSEGEHDHRGHNHS